MRNWPLIACVAIAAVLVAPPAAARAADPDAKGKPVWLAVTRPMFVKALAPLAALRRKDGFETVVSTESPARALAALKAAGKRPAFVLLVGDVQKGTAGQAWHVGTLWRTQYHWRLRGKIQFAADPLWGDLDGDNVPDVPVGRIPARRADLVKTVVQKTLAFEAKQLGPDDLRVPIWAGTPAYHPVIDSVATGLMVAVVNHTAQPWARMWLMSGDANHPLCGWPTDQAELFTKQLKRDRVLAVMMGHGSTTSFFSMRHRGRGIYYQTHHTKALASGPPRSPMIILTCSSGNFTWSGTCLTESLLAAPGGPTVAIGAAAESHPLPNYFTGAGLLKALGGKHRRIGTLWLAAQKHMLADRDLIVERILLSSEGNIQRAGLDHRKLRADQIMLYALLGDPASRVFLPHRLRGRIDWKDGTCHWQVRRPAGATRLYVSFRPAGRPAAKTGKAPDRAEALKRLAQANAAYAFKPISQIGPDAPWKGKIAAEGVLRLIATGTARIHVAAIGLKRPASK